MKATITLCSAIITLLTLACVNSYEDTEQDRIQVAYQDNLEQDRIIKEQQLAAERLGSLTQYYHLYDSLANKHKWKKAALYLDSALVFSTYTGEDSLIEKRAELHFKGHDYELAITDYSSLIKRSVNSGENLYKRALCYQKLKEIQLAVNDLREAITFEHKDAEKLHEKINPERKRISYYVTRCWDGSTSNSNGRGACSHHGGVKNWNEPIYETYRKY